MIRTGRGDGITKDDILLKRDRSTLYLGLKDESANINEVSNRIEIACFFEYWDSGLSSGKIEKIEFSDGSYLSDKDIHYVIQQMSSFSDDKGITLDSFREHNKDYQFGITFIHGN